MTITRDTKRRASPKPIEPSPTMQNGVTVADLLKRLGNIPASRVRLYPTPGTATEKDVIKVLDRENRPCELVDGTLVEKPMGYDESEIAATIIILLGSFVRRHKLGIVTGPDGTIRLFPGLVRIPDVAFASWDCFPGRKRPKGPDPPFGARPRCRGAQQEQHQGRDEPQAPRVLRGRRAVGLDGAAQEADGAGIHCC